MGDNEHADFEWLADLSKSQAFTTCGLSQPAKSLDFGADGFTASLTDSHELLQITRPDDTCGLLFVRGAYPDRADSILSRAQRRDDSGTSGTFGTKLLPPDPQSEFPDVELGERKAQGWINFRWPYAQYELIRRHPSTRDILGTGTCEIISSVSNGTVFQIHRLRWGRGTSVSDHDDADSTSFATARFRVRGCVRFGCPCSSAADGPAEHKDAYAMATSGSNLSCTSMKYQMKLELGLQILGTQQSLLPSPCSGGAAHGDIGHEWVDMTSECRVKLPFGDHEGVCVVSTYALRSAATTAPASPPIVSLPPILEEYLGIDRQSASMTDRLWTALCSANYEAVEAVELCVVGRCVEQILGVTSVPISKPQRITGSGQDDHDSSPELALIGNIMTFQYVDVESAFYQIRLLAKTYHFIESRKLERDFVGEFAYRNLEDIKKEYLGRLKDTIIRALTWLFRTDLKPGRLLLAVHSKPAGKVNEDVRLESCTRGRVQMTWDSSYNRGCYATMAAWYVYTMCQDVITNQLATEVLIPLLPQAYKVGMQRAERDKQPTSKANVLQWLHFSCILLLYHELGCEENADHSHHKVDLNIKEVRETQERFEKAVSRLKTSPSDGWSAEYDELDRVVLLADEMGLDQLKDNTKSHSLAVSRARQTRRRIRNRKRTAKFHQGPKASMAARSLSNGPWELLCIHHEAFLNVADESNVSAARDRVFEFLLSDYSFMASWDRADSNMVGTWWDIQPVAMIASTLLTLKLDGKLQAAKSTVPLSVLPVAGGLAEYELSRSVGNLRAGTNHFEGSDVDPATSKVLDAGQLALINALVHQLKQSMEELKQSVPGNEELGSKVFTWASQRPLTLYHPDWWATPPSATSDFFWAAVQHLGTGLKRYLQSHGTPDFRQHQFLAQTARDIANHVAPDELHLVKFIDISQDRRGFMFRSKWRSCTRFPGLPKTQKHPPPPTRPPGNMGQINMQTVDNGARQNSDDDGSALVMNHKSMLQLLNTSLLDAGVKHRVFVLQRCSPALVSAFINLWHPDAIGTVNDHLGTVSRFTESREKSTWTTSITVSHWTIRTREEHESDRFLELHRQDGLFPPDNIVQLGLPAHMQAQHKVEEQSSSLVISGDTSGHLWLCSYWSSVTEPESVATIVGEVLPRILEKFIHQQASGRCLAFLLLLGLVCENLSAEYTKLLTRLDGIMEIQDRTLLKGLEDWWGTDESINKLKKMLWGWEALRVFNDKLSSSLSQIQRAEEAMEHILKQDAMQQDQELIQEANSVLDDYKKRYGMLVEVHDKIQLKIKQVTGLRDGISTITNVVDNKTTIQQGNNIRALTYITIAYLPLGFIVALFSIQHATFMDGAENWHFALLTVVFSLATWVLAFSLDKAMGFFKAGGLSTEEKSDKERLPATMGEKEEPDWLGRPRRKRGAALGPIELGAMA